MSCNIARQLAARPAAAAAADDDDDDNDANVCTRHSLRWSVANNH